MANDVLNLLPILNETGSKYDLDVLIVTNKNGIVLGRSNFLGERGDNLLLTTNWAKDTLSGKSVHLIDQSKFFPLAMIAGSPIKNGNDIIGAVFLLRFLNSNYASLFKKGSNTDVVFYRSEEHTSELQSQR